MFFLSNYKLLVAFAGWELGSLSHLLPSSWYISPAAYLVHRYVPDKLRGGMISLSLAPANAAILFFLLQVCTFILNYNDTASHILTCIHNNQNHALQYKHGPHFHLSMDRFSTLISYLIYACFKFYRHFHWLKASRTYVLVSFPPFINMMRRMVVLLVISNVWSTEHTCYFSECFALKTCHLFRFFVLKH